MNKTNLSSKHLLLALLTVVVWGLNFIAIYLGVKELPPFFFCTLRFGLSAFPLIFFLPKPQAPFKYVIGFGLFNFALQFGLLFSGISLGLSAGLASLILQMQVFFSMILSFLIFNEKPNYSKILGLLISFIGIIIVACNIKADVTLIGLVLTLFAAFSWAAGNMFTKKINAKSSLSLVVWGNLVAFPFMALTTLYYDGVAAITSSVQGISWIGVGAVAYVVFLATHLGYGIWGELLKSYPTSMIVPFTLLIPIVGFLSSAFFLGEELTSWKICASLFIMSGLIFSLFDKKIKNLFDSIKTKKSKYL